jgi:hypothetical protein
MAVQFAFAALRYFKPLVAVWLGPMKFKLVQYSKSKGHPLCDTPCDGPIRKEEWSVLL